MRATEIYSKQIYDGKGYYIDSVSDLILDVQTSHIRIIGLTTPTLSRKNQMIPYSAIKAIGDIIILKDKQ